MSSDPIGFRRWSRQTPDSFGTGLVDWDYHNEVWYKSFTANSPPKEKGKLRSNTFTRETTTLIERRLLHPNGLGWVFAGGRLTPTQYLGARMFDSAAAESYARFRGKMYKGSASLGVTFGSWRQSKDMIVDRYKQLDRSATSIISAMSRTRVTPKMIASAHLEIIFGWKPLYQDIHAAATSVIQDSIPSEWIRAKSTFVDQRTFPEAGDFVRRRLEHVYVRGSYARYARTDIKNPNLWLAERAGLLNPAAVAWDLVPWSFLVNMFVNTGQLVNSITDFVGVEFTNSGSTTNARYLATAVVTDRQRNTLLGDVRWTGSEKYNLGGAATRPPFVFKVPDLNWETAAMAASLATQKVRRATSLVDYLGKGLKYKNTSARGR